MHQRSTRREASSLKLHITLTLGALALSALPTKPSAAPAPAPANPTTLATINHVQGWARAHEQPLRWAVRAGGLKDGLVVGESTLSARWDERGYLIVTDRMRAQRTSGGAPLDLILEREKVYQGDPPYALLEAYFYEASLGEARAGAWKGGRWWDLEEAPHIGREGGAPGQGITAARAALEGGGRRSRRAPERAP